MISLNKRLRRKIQVEGPHKVSQLLTGPSRAPFIELGGYALLYIQSGSKSIVRSSITTCILISIATKLYIRSTVVRFPFLRNYPNYKDVKNTWTQWYKYLPPGLRSWIMSRYKNSINLLWSRSIYFSSFHGNIWSELIARHC